MMRSVWLMVVLIAACSRELPYGFPDVGPYLHQPACVECLQNECAPAWTGCMDDAVCAEEYECRGQCNDPICHLACRRELVSMKQDADDWVSPPLVLDPGDALFNCAAQRCDDTCAIGRDFGCVGRYEEPVSVAPRMLELEVAALDFFHERVPGMTGSVCAQGDLVCQQPTDTADFSSGRAALTLTAQDGGHRQHLVFKVDGADAVALENYPVNYDWQTLQWDIGRFAMHYVFKRSISAVFWDMRMVPYDIQRPGMSVVAFDCAGVKAAGLRLEVDADCTPFERCDFYWDGATLLANGEETKTSGTASVTVSPPANQPITVRLVDTETGGLVTQFTTNLAPATQHTWWAYPLTGDQLKALPK